MTEDPIIKLNKLVLEYSEQLDNLKKLVAQIDYLLGVDDESEDEDYEDSEEEIKPKKQKTNHMDL